MSEEPLRWRPSWHLVLASASPQRRAILDQLGVSFVARPTEVAELGDGEPTVAAAENARRKALAGMAALEPSEREVSVVLACDTVVTLDGRLYGKPADEAQARRYLAELQGRSHDVLGAIAVVTAEGRLLQRIERTSVTFAPLEAAQIAAHVALGEWRGRAGGYAIQGRGAALVERIDGDYLNVVGLPVPALRGLVQGLVPSF